MTIFNSVTKRRVQRDSRPKISVINKSGGVVKLYYMDTRYHTRRYFAKLRVNEKTGIRSRAGTTWLAYNMNDEPLYMNTKYNFLVLPHHANRKNNVIITASKSSANIDRVTIPKQTSPYYIEVLLVADSSVFNHYKTKAKVVKYIKVLMQATNQVFADKSIDVKLHVVLKKIELYTRNVASLDFPLRTPSAAVSKICKHLYRRQRILNKKIDFGIVLTRRDFGYAGFTPLYQMCSKSRSCTLIKDNGLQSAFVIAHEIAHALGVSHDGDLNECHKNEFLGSVMGRTVYSKFSQFHWSNCSRLQLHQNIRDFNCLWNQPGEFRGIPKQLPGEYFDIDEQCAYTFGPKYGNCLKPKYGNKQCRFLYCRIPDKRRNLCSLMNVAPVDGTKCAEGRWCIRGKCLPHGKKQPEPIDGGWSNWSTWSKCTHTCGKGLQKRRRTCTNPRPEYNGKNCTGISFQWSVCSQNPCDVELTEGDRRDYFCYGFHGDGWEYFSRKKFLASIGDTTNWKCDFEHDLCSWKNSGTSEIVWTRNNGSTITQETGPDFDYTYRNSSGHYLYMESSHPMGRDESVKLTSPIITTPEVCLHFAYHMKGRRLGTLKVNLVSEKKDHLKTVWEKVRHQSTGWLAAKISIQNNRPFMIELEAIRASSYYSDIAIDDIQIQPHLCENNGSQSNPCNLPCFHKEKKRYKFDQYVPNGEKCYPESSNMCINGKCQAIGCDGKFNSTKKFDRCDVCGGDNKTCFYTDGVLQISSTELDQSVMMLAKNLKDIRVKKLSITPASLAIRNKRTRSRTFYQTPPRHYRYYYFKMAQAHTRYLVENKTQHVYLDGKISHELEIQLSHPGSTYDITKPVRVFFSYIIPKDTRGFVLRIVRWTNCTKVCNTGSETAQYSCMEMPSGKEHEMSKCLPSGVSLIENKRACNNNKCSVSYSIKLSKWSACSTCGKSGIRTRTVQCLQRVQGDVPMKTSMEYCKAYPRYETKIKCYKPCKKVQPCIERSKVCPRMFLKGYCKYSSVRSLCCKTCKQHHVPLRL